MHIYFNKEKLLAHEKVCKERDAKFETKKIKVETINEEEALKRWNASCSDEEETAETKEKDDSEESKEEDELCSGVEQKLQSSNKDTKNKRISEKDGDLAKMFENLNINDSKAK